VIAPMCAARMGQAMSDPFIEIPTARPRASPSSGSGARCSRCTSRPVVHRNIATAIEALTALRRRILGSRSRVRGGARIDLEIELILEQHRVRRYLQVKRVPRPEHTFKQTQHGCPRPDTEYRRVTRRRYDLEWSVDQAAIDYDKKSDGMYPLICNDRNLTAAQVLKAHKGQPTIEKQFEQIKTVHEIAPVFLKNPGRIEALFTLYFLALLLQALIERELRLAMKQGRGNQRVADLPRTAPLQAPDHRADPATRQPRRAAYAPTRRQAGPVLSSTAQRHSASDTRSARRSRRRVPRLIDRRKFTRNHVCDLRNVVPI
jgi:hypothetical protein